METNSEQFYVCCLQFPMKIYSKTLSFEGKNYIFRTTF